MVKSMFAAVAGLRAHQGKLDVIGNNIANVNTYGFKTQRATFRDVFYATNQGASDAGPVYGGTNPSQLGYGSMVGSIDSIMTSGGVAATDKPLDCMVTGNGFFLVGTRPGEEAGKFKNIEIIPPKNNDPNTTTGTPGAPKDANALADVKALSLTRVGNFNIDGQGNLVDSAGRMVYGFPPKDDKNNNNPANPDPGGTKLIDQIDHSKLTALRVPPAKPADPNAPAGTDTKYVPQALHSITVGRDGMITGVGDGGKTVVIGQIALVNVPNPEALEREGQSYYKAKANTGEITVNPSGQNSTGTIQSGVLEMSNVDLAREFTEMITTQRGLQANTRIITVTDQVLEELVNMKR